MEICQITGIYRTECFISTFYLSVWEKENFTKNLKFVKILGVRKLILKFQKKDISLLKIGAGFCCNVVIFVDIRRTVFTLEISQDKNLNGLNLSGRS